MFRPWLLHFCDRVFQVKVKLECENLLNGIIPRHAALPRSLFFPSFPLFLQFWWYKLKTLVSTFTVILTSQWLEGFSRKEEKSLLVYVTGIVEITLYASRTAIWNHNLRCRVISKKNGVIILGCTLSDCSKLSYIIVFF